MTWSENLPIYHPFQIVAPFENWWFFWWLRTKFWTFIVIECHWTIFAIFAMIVIGSGLVCHPNIFCINLLIFHVWTARKYGFVEQFVYFLVILLTFLYSPVPYFVSCCFVIHFRLTLFVKDCGCTLFTKVIFIGFNIIHRDFPSVLGELHVHEVLSSSSPAYPKQPNHDHAQVLRC